MEHLSSNRDRSDFVILLALELDGSGTETNAFLFS